MKPFDELTLADDFMFSKIMEKPELCKKLVEIILRREIDHIEIKETQYSISPYYRRKGVRLDAFLKDGMNTVYNVEMQTSDFEDLPKRSRYYHSIIDAEHLQKGQDYSELGDSYVIFICTKDIFKENKCVYTFKNYCSEVKGLKLLDGSTSIFVNPYGNMENINKELSNFLRYLASNEACDAFTQEIDELIIDIKADEEGRMAYMKYEADMMDARREGKREGLAQGKREGIEANAIIVYKNCLARGFSKEDAIAISEISEETLAKIESE